MDARTALRRLCARVVAQPDFDPVGIPNVENLINELQNDYPEFVIASRFQRTGTTEQSLEPSPVG
jgi:hypothetical protein